MNHASDAALKLRTDLEALHPPSNVTGGVILVASCSGGQPEAMEISGGSKSAVDHMLGLRTPSRLQSPSGDPVARGIFGSWQTLVARVGLATLPNRDDVAARKRFLADAIAECEKAGVNGILGPAMVESRPVTH